MSIVQPLKARPHNTYSVATSALQLYYIIYTKITERARFSRNMLLHFFCRWHCQLLVDGVGRKLPAGGPNTVTYRVLVTNHLLSANQVDISPLVSRKEFLCNRHGNWWTERGRRGWQNTDSAICSRFKQFILKIDPAGGINQSPWQQQSDPSTTDKKRQHKHSP